MFVRRFGVGFVFVFSCRQELKYFADILFIKVFKIYQKVERIVPKNK